MTIETRSSIQLSDLVAFEVECSQCHTKTIRKLAGIFEVPIKCGNCGMLWMVAGGQEHNGLRQLLESLHFYCTQQPNKTFALRFEVSNLRDERSQ